MTPVKTFWKSMKRKLIDIMWSLRALGDRENKALSHGVPLAKGDHIYVH